ncbi:DUF4153 domain-containing protein [Nocardia sp. KC 131]|uniref:DUF4153 domain-containing protein n=1 Tax=Nocardia arseniciresistens TaxID=3392119 RepID=UPI00398E7405
MLPAVGIAGVSGAALIPLDRPGIGWVLAAVVAASAVFVVDHRARRAAAGAEEASADGDRPSARRGADDRRMVGAGSAAVGSGQQPSKTSVPNREAAAEDVAGARDVGTVRNRGRLWWSAAALMLLAVGTFRAAGWLFVLCVLAACVAGSLAAVGRRSANGVWYDVIAVPIESFAALPWVYAALSRVRGSGGTRSWRVAGSVAVTVALLAVFVPLLSGADATFAKMLASVTPEIAADSVVRWIVLFVVVGLGSLGAMYLLAGPPAEAATGGGPEIGRSLHRLEWALPVGALTALFAVFVGAQFVALFGGDSYVQRTGGLTYAEYARSGFWQLSIVTMLTLAVILVVLRGASKDSVSDRIWLRTLLCAISLLSLVIVASALGRMWTYQQAYGFTVLRVLVEVCELWLGLVYLLVIAAVLRLERAWLPRAAIGTAMATLLALAVLNPEALVADKNIDRWQHGKELDTEYLSTLSPDIFPVMRRLPEPLRAEVLDPIRADLDGDSWQGWNLSRARAR